MGQLLLNRTTDQKAFESSPHTGSEYDLEGSPGSVLSHVGLIQDALNDLDKSCYVIGFGGIAKDKYQKLAEIPGANLVFLSSHLPKPLLFLSWLVASYEGVIKISNHCTLASIFSTLSEQSMAGIYIFDKSIEDAFLENACDIKSSSLSYGIKADPAYFIYVADCDSYESSTGIYEIVSYGVSASFVPEQLRR